MGLVYFNVLGLDPTSMDLEHFGSERNRDLTIYNRFFRTVLKSGVNYFFSEYDRIVVNRIYHDKGSQEVHNLFPWYTGYSVNLGDEERILIEDEHIKFIDSDHRVYPNEEGDLREESQFIQFIDLIMGSIFCCLHDPAQREEKKRIGLTMKPLLKRLMHSPRNVNSSYHYHRKQQVSFFPRTRLDDIGEAYRQLDIFGNLVTDERSEWLLQEKAGPLASFGPTDTERIPSLWAIRPGDHKSIENRYSDSRQVDQSILC